MARPLFPELKLAATAVPRPLCGRWRRGRRAGRPARALRKIPGAALAGGRRARHGQHPRRGDDDALRLAPLAARRAHLRSLVRALEHHAEVAVREPVPGQAQADRRRAVLGPCLQQRSLRRRRRAAAAGHADRCARPLRVDHGAVGSEEPLLGRRRQLLRRLQAEGREAQRRLAAAEARHREDPAAGDDGAAARRAEPRRQGPGDGRRRGGHRRAHRGHAEGPGAGQARHPARRHGLDLHRLERAAGRTARKAPRTTRWRRGCRRRGQAAFDQAHRRRSASTRPSSTRCPNGMLQGKAAPARARSRACRSRSITTCCRCSGSIISRT